MKFNKTILSNGLRLITVPMKDNPTVTVMVLVEAGSKYESKDISGISHFLEHMCFKGTGARPTALHIAKELDSIGSQCNAFTSHEFTGYFAKADYKHKDKILDIVSDLYLNPTLPEKEIEKEKGVIIEEINMYEDLPQRKVGELFFEVLYGDQPAGWNIVGTKETVKATTRDALAEYRERNYVSGATTVLICGNIDEEAAKNAVMEKFTAISAGEKHKKTKVEELQASPAVCASYKKTDQSHVVIGARTFDVYDKRNATLKVLTAILGGGMSSRLFQKVREEMGAAYYVRAETDAYTDHGYLAVSAGVQHGKIKEVIEAILGEFKKIKENTVEDEEVKKAKDYLTGNFLLSLESSDSLADYYGYQEVLKKELKKPEEAVAEINAVNAGHVYDLAKDIFKNEKLNMAVIGPYEETKEFEDILHF
ncbi:MAG: pitrilysin family protein [bacterium]|nr:pitrilysin family protein [bacterium]